MGNHTVNSLIFPHSVSSLAIKKVYGHRLKSRSTIINLKTEPMLNHDVNFSIRKYRRQAIEADPPHFETAKSSGAASAPAS